MKVLFESPHVKKIHSLKKRRKHNDLLGLCITNIESFGRTMNSNGRGQRIQSMAEIG